MAHDHPHSFRVDDELWQAARAAAGRRGTNVTAVLVGALNALVELDAAERAFTEGLTPAEAGA